MNIRKDRSAVGADYRVHCSLALLSALTARLARCCRWNILCTKSCSPLLLERIFLTTHAWNMRASAVGDQPLQLQPAALLSEYGLEASANSCQPLVADSSICT